MAGKFDRFRENVRHHEGHIGVAISGGLDSAAVLHELCERNDPSMITAYCLKQGADSLEYETARGLAMAYAVGFDTWDFRATEYHDALAECMQFFDRPRWNVWPFILLKKAVSNSTSVFYVGEGSDEIFGYRDRCYLRGWISQLEYIWPVWRQCSEHFGIELHAPFLELETSLDGPGLPATLGYFCGSLKQDLWNEYRDKLKASVIYPKVGCVAYYDILRKNKRELLIEATRLWLCPADQTIQERLR